MLVEVVAHAIVEEDIAEQASAIFAEVGMTVDRAFRQLLLRTVEGQIVPFDPLIPNQETIDAMLAGRRGEVKRFNTVEELMADLHGNDEPV